MGTRSVTRVFEGDTEVCTIYRHWDGYPEGHGAWLIEALEGKTAVNGWCSAATKPKQDLLNGAGRAAGYLIAKLYNDGHNPDVLPTGTKDADQDYEYHVKMPTIAAIDAAKPAAYDGLPIGIECFHVEGGWGDRPRTLTREPFPASLNESEGVKEG